MSKRNIHFLEAAMKHKQVVIAFVVMLMLMGTKSLLDMPRSENPRIVLLVEYTST